MGIKGNTLVFGVIAMALLTACGKPAMDAKAAKYEAQKLLAVVDGNAKSAAFMDQVLQDEEAYKKYFTQELNTALAAAPVGEAAFTPFADCVTAGTNLSKFAELRRLGGRQNDQSDAYRTPFWDALRKCKKAVDSTP